MNAIRLYFRLVRVSLRTQMAYRASFSVQMLANIATTLADFFAVFAFFQRFGALGHWSFAQVAVFYGMANASLALSELWLRGFDIFERHVQSGDFDRYLPCFKKIIPNDYNRMLSAISKMEEQGLSREQAELEAFLDLQ